MSKKFQKILCYAFHIYYLQSTYNVKYIVLTCNVLLLDILNCVYVFLLFIFLLCFFFCVIFVAWIKTFPYSVLMFSFIVYSSNNIHSHYFFRLILSDFNLYFIFSAEPLPLMDLCRRVIRQRVGKQQLEERISDLNLPHAMTVYLLYRDRR